MTDKLMGMNEEAFNSLWPKGNGKYPARYLLPMENYEDDMVVDDGSFPMVAILDVETTGFDPETDEIIQLSIIKCKVEPGMKRLHPVEIISEYNEPSKPIPPEIIELTGITDDDVQGCRITEDDLNEWLDPERIKTIIAHNAPFDYKHMVAHGLKRKHVWADSITDLNPKEYFGCDNNGLESVLAYSGGMYMVEHHQSLSDVWAVYHILNTEGALERTLKSAWTHKYLVEWAFPFNQSKIDHAKAHGMKWNPKLKTWRILVDSEDRFQELREMAEIMDDFYINKLPLQDNMRHL